MIAAARHVRERQDGNSGVAWSGRAGLRRIGGVRQYGRRLGIAFLTNETHETIAPARQRPDEALCVAIVADRTPDGIDACRHCGVGNAAPAPDRGDEIVLADDAIA